MLTAWTKQFLVASGFFAIMIAAQVAHMSIKNINTFNSAPRTATVIESHTNGIN